MNVRAAFAAAWRLSRWQSQCTYMVSPANAESLKQALSGAYRYNPKLDAERARQRATDEEVARALSGYQAHVIQGSADRWSATDEYQAG